MTKYWYFMLCLCYNECSFVLCFRGCWTVYQMLMHFSCRTVFVIFPMCMTVWVLTVVSV